MSVVIEPIKPLIGGRVRVDRKRLCDDDVVEAVRAALEDRLVLVFPELGASDEEQLAFTDRLGGRINFTRQVQGERDVYKVTLDREIHDAPAYVLGTFFWHIDGVHSDIPLPKGTLLSARKLSDAGGRTEFANLYAAYEKLPEAEKREIDALWGIHTLEASVRPVYGNVPPEKQKHFRGTPMEHPLVWTHDDGRKSLLIGTHADGVVGMPGPHGRALLWRLQQWAAQPDFVYGHDWKIGDLVVWNNQGLMHRVTPYTDPRRIMHRTSLGGTERPGRLASAESVAGLMEPAI
jgi:alpha-ketoglutarate-dependent taurine dioxygenase